MIFVVILQMAGPACKEPLSLGQQVLLFLLPTTERRNRAETTAGVGKEGEGVLANCILRAGKTQLCSYNRAACRPATPGMRQCPAEPLQGQGMVGTGLLRAEGASLIQPHVCPGASPPHPPSAKVSVMQQKNLKTEFSQYS